MEQEHLASFIIRFHLVGMDEATHKKRWRIKVTNVQANNDTLFETIEDAMLYLKSMTDYS
ncbi:hypothetical protein [Bacillus sp. B15-48]|uniref:hypothetical protein n=1 Tax=Bacillus sp. B15-48 TaxID=1548601 RepID=UPI00193EFE1C|nr:hypothetical protein [Bacillus sp. B15-48]MBM4763523.1 hypothetical protein [Bacillus sp. B15-48]